MSEEVTYQHQPLPDRQRYIRLLEIDRTSTIDAITCRVTTVEFNEAPDYAAISYTWGEPLPIRTVNIDGYNFTVRENTVYSLWQAAQYGKYAWYWLDAICINQDDLVEKSAQVELMGAIYSQAARVIVSLGDHFDDSELILSTARDLDASTWCARTGRSGHEYVKQKFEWFQSNALHDEGHKKIASAWKSFCRRPYWSRAWIYQEIMLARRWAVELMVGQDVIDWFKITQLYDDIAIYLADGDEIKTMGFTKLLMFRDRLDLGLPQVADALQFASEAECFDLRDRVYGFLRLCYWPDDLPSFVPDYTRGKLDLALEVVRYLERCFQCFTHVEIVLQALRIDAQSPEVIELLKFRKIKPESTLRKADLSPLTSVVDDSGSKARAFVHCNDCCRITRSDYSNNGHLTAALMKRTPATKEYDEPESSLKDGIDSMLTIRDLGAMQTLPKPLMIGNEAVALLTPDALPGDILARIKRGNGSSISWCACFVLREVSDELYQIIGQAILDQPYIPCNGDKLTWHTCLDTDLRPEAHPKVEKGFQIYFDPEDLLLWSVQDTLLEPDPVLERQLLLQRWHTAVTSSSFSSYAVSTEQTVLNQMSLAECTKLEERGRAAMQNMEDEYYRLYGGSNEAQIREEAT